MNGGIDQLVDTYKVNPQPLNEKVQKAQQGQPPGEIPADLEEALALQEIAKLRQGAQNQQAMQAGGAQPSVVEKLRQMLGGMQQQAQMAPPAQGAPAPQGQPVMAARGGSIDQLMSNLGRHYAGGGIVAFNGKDSSQFVQDLSEIPQAFDDLKQRAREEDARRAAEDRRMEQYKQEKLAAQQKTSLFNYLFGSPEREKEGQTKLAELSNAPLPKSAEPAYTDPEVEKLKRLAAARSQTGVSTNPDLVPRKPIVGTSPDDAKPKPTGAPGAGGSGAAAAAEQLDPNSLRGLTEAYIKGEFKLSPEQERDKAIEFARKTMGLDALLGEKERRANEREAMIKQVQSGRTPAWVEGLIAAGKPVRGGFGSLLGQMGNAAQGTREAYQNQDLAYQKELAHLRDVITDAKIDGNKELVKQGMAAYKEVDARRRAAATNATSLVATDENVAMRKQVAKEGAANRALTQQGAADQRKIANAINAVKNDEVINRLQKRADELGKSLMAKDRTEAAGILKQIEDRQNAIYKQFGVLEGLSTMSTAPSAASPSGTSKPGWGIKPI